jgi:hypothetical protein
MKRKSLFESAFGATFENVTGNPTLGNANALATPKDTSVQHDIANALDPFGNFHTISPAELNQREGLAEHPVDTAVQGTSAIEDAAAQKAKEAAAAAMPYAPYVKGGLIVGGLGVLGYFLSALARFLPGRR